MIETLTSLSHFLSENERIHRIAYYSPKYCGFREIEITGSDSLSAAVNEMINSFSDDVFSEDPAAYFAGRNDGEVSSFTLITSDISGKAASLLDESANAEIKNALVVVPVPGTPVQYAGENVRIIPVTAGHISASIKDLEL